MLLTLTNPVYAQQNCTNPNTGGSMSYGDGVKGNCATDPGRRVFIYCSDNGELEYVTQPDAECGTQAPPPAEPTSNIKKIFGEIKPPTELLPFVNKGGSGAGGISLFLTNLVALIYSLAAIVLIFMLLWGAFEWLTSGGEKEKLASAQQRILHAIIGIILFAIAFAVISILGIFTGFRFFAPTSNPGCPQREDTYEERGSKCFHTYYTGPNCTALYEDLPLRFCEKKK